jgi:hypothetical protein
MLATPAQNRGASLEQNRSIAGIVSNSGSAQRARITAQAWDLRLQQPSEMVHGSPVLVSLGHPIPDLNRPRSFTAKQPLPLGGVGNLDQHGGRAGLSAFVGGRSGNMKLPNGRHSFTSQHPDGEVLSKDLARHAPVPGYFMTVPTFLVVSLAEVPAHNL